MAFEACVRCLSLIELLSSQQDHNNFILGEALSRAVYPVASASIWLR